MGIEYVDIFDLYSNKKRNNNEDPTLALLELSKLFQSHLLQWSKDENQREWETSYLTSALCRLVTRRNNLKVTDFDGGFCANNIPI